MINFFNINKKSKIILINFLISVSFLVISFYFTYNAIYGNNGLKKSIILELEIIELNNKLNSLQKVLFNIEKKTSSLSKKKFRFRLIRWAIKKNSWSN